MTMTTAYSLDSLAAPDVAAIRAELEATKRAYQDLVGSLTSADFERPSLISRWTVKELLTHLVLGVEQANPMMLKQARKGKPMPAFLNSRPGNWLNYKMAVWGARKATAAELVRRYDAAIDRLAAALDEVGPGEWDLPTAYPDGRPLTVATIFHDPAAHLALHGGWIRQTLGR